MDHPDPSEKTTPKIQPGVAQPANLNPEFKARRKKKALHPEEYISGILEGNRVLLSQAITLVESRLPAHQQLAQQIIEQCLPHSGRSVRIGITGSPGVGKSTFIESLGAYLIEQGHRTAVLAIDPTSQVSKGSILGDKTRMPGLATDARAFIRPSPAGESLGGVARKTRETIILCEAAGYDTIIVETVGVGQSETAVHSMVDFFLLLLLPGGGDELQGMKRGIVEMADLIAINKADEERLPLAKRSQREYQNALHLFPPKESQWNPGVVLCSAQTGFGIPEIWTAIGEYLSLTRANRYFETRRKGQARYWLHESINLHLRELFYQYAEVKAQLPAIEKSVVEGLLSPFQGAEKLLKAFLKA